MEIHSGLFDNRELSFDNMRALLINTNSIYYKKRYMTKINNDLYFDILNSAFLLNIENKNNFASSADKRLEFDKKWKVFRDLFRNEWDLIEKEIYNYYMPNSKVEAGGEEEPTAPGELTP